jgi:hypothetical protein
MAGPITMDALRQRLARDGELAAQGQGDGTEHRLEEALDAIGWRSAGGSSSEEVAALAAHLVRGSVGSGRQPGAVIGELAELLRTHAATLDGSMLSASMFVPAAAEVLSRYLGD